jgi:cytochrome c oxidase assembly protein subunit 15
VLGLSGLAAVVASFVWPRSEPAKPWLRRLGILAFAAVVLQGILGGLRVVLFKDQIGIFHATLAQLFFVLMCALALFTSQWWETRIKTRGREVPGINASTRFSWLCQGATVLILAQLILGATIRHQHAGLAIADFPLAYGKVWPAMDVHSVAHYNQQRIEVLAANPITSTQILLQMVHRAMAIFIGALIVCCAWLARFEFGKHQLVSRLTLGWLGLIATQIVLGAATIWSNKAADIATAHVLVGALSLGVGAILSIILLEPVVCARGSSFVRKDSVVSPGSSFGVQPASFPGIE